MEEEENDAISREQPLASLTHTSPAFPLPSAAHSSAEPALM